MELLRVLGGQTWLCFGAHGTNHVGAVIAAIVESDALGGAKRCCENMLAFILSFLSVFCHFGLQYAVDMDI